MATNLSAIRYFSSQLPFVDEFKSSKSWVTKNKSRLNLDSNGWLKSLPNNSNSSVGTLLFRGHGTYLSGKYLVLYDGEGTIEYKLDATKNETLSTRGRDVIQVNPSTNGIFLDIIETDPKGKGNYIRNIRIIPQAQASTATPTSFNPEFIKKIQPFDTLRFMDWMDTNNSEQKKWTDRPQPEDARYSEIGVPVEMMVELANQTNSDPWFTIPHMATDEYVTQFARYVKNNLESDLDVYVEYSNEVWNGRFSQNKWAGEQAKKEFSDPKLNGLDWYGMRSTEVVKLWENAFNQDSERVIGVLGVQAANSRAGQNVLDYRWSKKPLSSSDTGIDAVAIAPYFGRYIGFSENEAKLRSWTKEADGGLNKLFQEITKGGLLANSPEGGALAEAYENIENYVQIAEQEDLRLISYEGGQHLAGVGRVQNNQAITDLFIAANRDRRMGTIYQDYLAQWSNLGGDLFVHYSDIRTHNKWGSWGALESVYQDSSPKYNALVNFAKNPEKNPNRGNILEGTGEEDVFIFKRSLNSSGRSKKIVNFVLKEDKIDVSNLNITQFETLQSLIEDNNRNNAVIESTLGGSLFELEIENLKSDRLTAKNFIFSRDSRDDETSGTTLDDDLFGGLGNDTLKGLTGSDRLFGESGKDLLEGGVGKDTLNGGNQNDTLEGGSGDDLLFGESGRDRLLGNKGNDFLNGGQGNDLLVGGSDTDLLLGGNGNDTLDGGSARDLFIFQTETVFDRSTIGVDSIVNFAIGQDRISLAKNTFKNLRNIPKGQLTNNAFITVTSDRAKIDSEAKIVYNKNNGRLFYNSQGSDRVTSDDLFAVLENSPDSLTASDFLVS